MVKPPTERQLNYIKGLGYSGPPPQDLEEASKLIDALKSGLSPSRAEKELASIRRELLASRVSEVRQYLKGLDEMNELHPTCRGFRLREDKDLSNPQSKLYHKAFIDLEIAHRYPEILLTPGIDYEELERRPSKGLFVVAPGKVQEGGGKTVARSKKSGCVLSVAVFALFVVLASWVLSMH